MLDRGVVRREAIKIGTAGTAGVALAATYVTPAMISIGTKVAQAASGLDIHPTGTTVVGAVCNFNNQISGSVCFTNQSSGGGAVQITDISLFVQDVTNFTPTTNACGGDTTTGAITGSPFHLSLPTGTLAVNQQYCVNYGPYQGLDGVNYRVTGQVTITDGHKIFTGCDNAQC